MRVTYLVSTLLPYTAQLANSVCVRHRVNVAIFEDSQPERFGQQGREGRLSSLDEWFAPSVELRLFDARRRRDPRSLWAVHKYLAAMQDFKPDVLHLHDTTDYRMLLAALALRRVPCVITVHDVEPHLGEEHEIRHERRFVRDALRRRANALIVHGERSKRKLLDTSDVRAERVHVINHGAFTIYRQWATTDSEEEPHTLLFFGRIFPYKGLDILLRSLVLVREHIPDVKLVVAGQGKVLREYQALLEESRPAVELLEGFVPDSVVSRLFQRASLVVLPYREASQSGVLMLAFAFGKPVVATTVGDIPDIVTNGITGVLVPPENIEALAQAIIGLLNDPEARQIIGNNALCQADTELSWDAIALQTADLYRREIPTR